MSVALITCWILVGPVCHAGEAEELKARKDRVNRRVLDWQRWGNDWNSRCAQAIIDTPEGNRCSKERDKLRAEKAAIQAEVAAVEAAIDKYNRSRQQQDLSSNAGKELKSARSHGETAATSESAEAASEEARKGFDTRGSDQGSLDSMTVDARGLSKQDPIIPESVLNAHPEMREVIAKRDSARAEIRQMGEQLKTLDRNDKNDQLKIATLSDQKQRKEREVQSINLSLKDQLQKGQ